jgi:O-antigen ligase
MVIGAAGALLYLVGTDVSRMRFDMLGEGVESRWEHFETMLKYFDDSPFFGCGLFYQPGSEHNIFLDALAGQGVPGLLFLLGFLALGVSFARGTTWRRCETESEMWRLAAVGIFAAMFWCSQVSMGVLAMNTLVWSLLVIWRLHEFQFFAAAQEGRGQQAGPLAGGRQRRGAGNGTPSVDSEATKTAQIGS